MFNSKVLKFENEENYIAKNLKFENSNIFRIYKSSKIPKLLKIENYRHSKVSVMSKFLNSMITKF